MNSEKPILFNTEMVKAILDGRKTCTRRLIKFLPGKNPQWTGYVKDGLMLYNGNNESCIRKAPYQPGNILYVRETFIQAAAHTFWYKADDKSWMSKDLLWKPSIHMPKEAARIWLKVKDVRVDRLQDITPQQAENEGVGNLFYEDIGYSEKNYGTEVDKEYGIAREQFAWLWNSTIKKSDIDRYGWDANPWVWVIEFERCAELGKE